MDLSSQLSKGENIEAIQGGHEYLYEISLDGIGHDETVLSLFFELESNKYQISLQQKLAQPSPIEEVTTSLKLHDPDSSSNGYSIPLFSDTEQVIMHVKAFGYIEDILDSLEVYFDSFNETINRSDWNYINDEQYQAQLENQGDILRTWMYLLADEQAQIMICNGDNCQSPKTDVNNTKDIITSGPVTDVFLIDADKEKLAEFPLPFYTSTVNVLDNEPKMMVITAGSGDWDCAQLSDGTECQNKDFSFPYEVLSLGTQSAEVTLTWVPLLSDDPNIEMKINDQVVSYSNGAYDLGPLENLDQTKITILDRSGNSKDILQLIEYGEAILQVAYPKHK